MKRALLSLTLLVAVPVAFAQAKPAAKEPAKPVAPAAAAPAAQPAPEKPAPVARKVNPRRAEDARHCLDKGSNTEVIKCAEAYL